VVAPSDGTANAEDLASGKAASEDAGVLCGAAGSADATCAAVAAELTSGLGMRLTVAHGLERRKGGRASGRGVARGLRRAARTTERRALAML